MKDSNRFYVYIHTKQTNGDLFYVGKGNGRRWRQHNGRNIHWERTVKKNGGQANILFAGLPEEIAFELETFVIKHFRDEGAKLANICDGGEGNSGTVRERKPMMCIETGQLFPCNQEAAKWVSSFGIAALPKTIQSGVLKNNRAYGLSWVYPEPGKAYVPTNAQAKPMLTSRVPKASKLPKRLPLPPPSVVCLETGTVYPSIRDALAWLYPLVPSAKFNTLRASLKGDIKGYGLTWRLAQPGQVYIATNTSAVPFHKAGQSVQCIETGEVFFNTTAAAQWVSKVRGKTSSRRKISDNCKGKTESAFGFTWRYSIDS